MKTTLFSSIMQWLFVIVFFTGIYYLLKYLHVSMPFANVHVDLTGWQVIIVALSIAFTWVEILKLGVTKPFNCVKCMTGWIALIIGCMVYGCSGIVFLFIGLFVGAMFEAVKMRWL